MLLYRNRILLLSMSLGAMISLLDIWSKNKAFSMLANMEAPSHKVLGVLNFVEVINKGISFGLFGFSQFSNMFFIAISLAITIGIAIYATIKTSGLSTAGLMMICGGSAGNLHDRIFFGGVRDFIDFHISGYHWPAFNIADATIFLGATVYLLGLHLYKNEDK